MGWGDSELGRDLGLRGGTGGEERLVTCCGFLGFGFGFCLMFMVMVGMSDERWAMGDDLMSSSI